MFAEQGAVRSRVFPARSRPTILLVTTCVADVLQRSDLLQEHRKDLSNSGI